MCDDGERDGEAGAVSGDGGCRAGGEGVEYYDVGGWTDGDAEFGGEVGGDGVVGGFGGFVAVGMLNGGMSGDLKPTPDGMLGKKTIRERTHEYMFPFVKINCWEGSRCE